MIDAIPGANTVANLLELANRALANTDGVVGSEGGVSLAAINDAVASVNEVFDECKVVIGWNVARCAPTDPSQTLRQNCCNNSCSCIGSNSLS